MRAFGNKDSTQSFQGGKIPFSDPVRIATVLLFSLFFLPCAVGQSWAGDLKTDPMSTTISGRIPSENLDLVPNADQTIQNSYTGSQIMAEVFQRHKLFPYVYEEQTMVLTDKAGHRDVRKMRRFSRLEKGGTAKILLVFDSPAEVRGTALRIIRHGTGSVENQIYLPALGEELSSGQAKDQGRDFLGTDFALEDLMESLNDFRYLRKPDQSIAKTVYFVVDAFPADDKKSGHTGYSMRRFFIRQDIYYIVRTDYYDRGFRFYKQLTSHDLQQVDRHMWRANMLFMENQRQNHTTLIKIDRRVFSRDYVLPKIFTPAWVGENRHINVEPNVESGLGEGSFDRNQSTNIDNSIGN